MKILIGIITFLLLVELSTTVHSYFRNNYRRSCSSILQTSPSFVVPIVNRQSRSIISEIQPKENENINTARAELLLLVSNSVPLSFDQHIRLEYLVKRVESSFTPVQTIPFLKLALCGTWCKKYTNVVTPLAASNFNYSILQCVHDQLIEERIVWTYEEKNSLQSIFSDGILTATSSYEINSKGQLLLSLLNHTLSTERMPQNITNLIDDLQSSVPLESFDPDETIQDITVSVNVICAPSCIHRLASVYKYTCINSITHSTSTLNCG